MPRARKVRGASLADQVPEVARQWHPTRNGDLTPHDVTPSAHRRVWWKCPEGPDHHWQQTVNARVYQNARCPACSGHQVSITNALNYARPAVAREWHPTKNGKLTAADVVYGSGKVVWWRCAVDPRHVFRAEIRARAEGKGLCPKCGEASSLAVRYPEIAAQWHPTKNGELTPRDLGGRSPRKVWWKCEKGPDHEWQSTPLHRQRSGCPFCGGRALSEDNSLLARAPQLAEEWHPTKNKGQTPDKVRAASVKKAWWRCAKDRSHEWSAGIRRRAIDGRGCPFCAGHEVNDSNSLAKLHPALAAQWDHEKNGALTPAMVTAGAPREVAWKCPQGPDHEWRAQIAARVRSSNCPFCVSKRVSVTNALATCAPDVAREWHPTKNGGLTPATVPWGSNKRVWWKCAEGPDHEWTAKIVHRTRRGSGSCPFCRGVELSVTNALARLYPRIAAEWHPTKNGSVTAEQVIASSTQFGWWRCPLGHAWRGRMVDRTLGGMGCPVCAEKLR